MLRWNSGQRWLRFVTSIRTNESSPSAKYKTSGSNGVPVPAEFRVPYSSLHPFVWIRMVPLAVFTFDRSEKSGYPNAILDTAIYPAARSVVPNRLYHNCLLLLFDRDSDRS